MNDDKQDLTLVLDIGKSHAKLLMIDAAGAVLEQYGTDCYSVISELGYPALHVVGLMEWITDMLTGSEFTRRCARVIASAHGAAFVALGEGGLAWEPLDYEFELDDDDRPLQANYLEARDGFAATLAPDLPAGLNGARQLYWLQQRYPEAWAETRCLLPYPQFWACWLSGVAVSEQSSLGCHTQLWRPSEARFSDLARNQGWADLFAPLRPAWGVLGPVRADIAEATGLPVDCQVHVGVHDSNACLARYLHGGAPMTLVSSGTWIVVMAPGAPEALLEPGKDMHGNVSVRGEVVPTARFMGGRVHEMLCGDASPELASLEGVADLLRDEVHAFSSADATAVTVMRRGRLADPADELSRVHRASLAALHCAEVTADLLQRLQAPLPAVIEGPFASNPVYLGLLAALLPPRSVCISNDPVEGTARGAWMLANWDDRPVDAAQTLQWIEPAALNGLQAHHQAWQDLSQRPRE